MSPRTAASLLRRTALGSVAALLVCSAARTGRADEVVLTTPDRPASARAPGRHFAGLTFDAGPPDGAALGISLRPWVDWLRFGAAGTYNGMGPGVRAGLTLDPVAAIVGPTLTVEVGHCWAGRPLWDAASPTASYDYANLHLGLEFGSRSRIRVFARGGISRVDVTSALPQMGTDHTGVSFSGWLVPSGKVGVAVFF